MVKNTGVKTEKIVARNTTIVFISSGLILLFFGIYTEAKTTIIIIPFSAIFIATGLKLCKIEKDILNAIKYFK